MSTLTPTPPEAPESRPAVPQSPELPKELGAAIRERLGPALQIANDHAAEQAREEARRAAEQRKPISVAPTTDVVHSEPPTYTASSLPPEPVQVSTLRESVMDGAVNTGIAAAGVSTLYPYGTSVLAPIAANAVSAGALPSASVAGLALGVPALGAAAGYYLGKKVKHPAVGAIAGTAAGAAASMAIMPTAAIGVGGTTFETVAAGALFGAPVLGSLALSAAGTAAGWGLNYGLGRWHEHVWGSQRTGFWRTNLRGLIASVSIPVGYIRKLF